MSGAPVSRVLYDNPFSPFARKVRMVLHYKGLPFASVDALSHEKFDELKAVNPRHEVPVLCDGEVVVVNSADIVAYLDHRYPDPPVYPADPALRVQARAWERLSDSTVDVIVHNVSIWMWPTLNRTDTAPDGLVQRGMQELHAVYAQLEETLGDDGFLCGAVSVADLALFPHLTGARVLGIGISADEFPKAHAWYQRLRAVEVCKRDLAETRQAAEAMAAEGPSRYENVKIKWRGDRLEWMLSRGFHDWWAKELAEGRVEWPMAD